MLNQLSCVQSDRLLSIHSVHNGQVPPHDLKLKVNDVCLLYRTLSKKDRLATNTRVRILELSRNRIRVQTLDRHRKVHWLPRIYFVFCLPFGNAYKMRRKQVEMFLSSQKYQLISIVSFLFASHPA